LRPADGAAGSTVALALDHPEWHARELSRAAATLGLRLCPFRIADCAFDTTAPHGLRLPGFGDALPAAILVRSIGGGSFEEVTRRLGILHALRELGVPVLNDARAVERCVDKSTTTFLLAAAGLPVPPSWTVEGADAARALVAREAGSGPLVCKPLFGAQGRDLRLVRTPDELPPPEAVAGVYHLQRFLAPAGDGFRDHRLFVIGERVVAAMTRQADGWITNLHQGGRAEAYDPPPEVARIAVRATACVGADFAGVDVLRGADGTPCVLEVNSMPGWRGLQDVSPERIAVLLLRAVGDRLAGTAPTGGAAGESAR
jgi:RimK family alpha-L-glutamate ligase